MASRPLVVVVRETESEWWQWRIRWATCVRVVGGLYQETLISWGDVAIMSFYKTEVLARPARPLLSGSSSPVSAVGLRANRFQKCNLEDR